MDVVSLWPCDVLSLVLFSLSGFGFVKCWRRGDNDGVMLCFPLLALSSLYLGFRLFYFIG